MKIFIKDLPSNKELKEYYNVLFKVNEKNLNIENVTKSKNSICLEFNYKEDLFYIPPFYIQLTCINTKNKRGLLIIDKKHFDHVQRNYKEIDYLKSLIK